MSLIVETGAIVPGANSYVDDATFTAYAEARGITLPATPEEREVLLIKAMDYLETLDTRYQGYRVQGIEQPLLWPRAGVVFSGAAYSDDAIPAELKKAQMVLAIAAQTIDLLPNVTGSAQIVTRKTVGPITFEYAPGKPADTIRPIVSQANALLGILFGTSGQLRVVRA